MISSVMRSIALLYVSKPAASGAATVNPLTFLTSMGLGYQGSPFVRGHAQAGVSLQSMAYAFRGQPFVPYRRAS